MARASELRTNFTAGELSKLVNARTDFGRFYNGSETVENFVITPQGPLIRRKGWKFISEVKDSSKKTIIREFEFSDNIKYVIEIGNGYMRFFKDQGKLLDNETTISAATQTNPVIITDTSHPYSNGDKIIIEDVAGMIELNNKEFTISNKTANTYELLGINGAAFNAYSSGGTSSKIHEISSPYQESDLGNIRYVQDSDIMYFFHPSYPIYKLIRTAVNVFSINEVHLLRGPFLDKNIVSTDLVALSGGPWKEGDTGTLTASGGHTPFTADHVGGLWKITDDTDIAFLKITGYTSSTVVSVSFQKDIPTVFHSGTHFGWSEGEFSNARSFPAAATIHEQRLVLSGSPSNPLKVFFSRVDADYENFEAGVEDNEAFNLKIGSTTADPIRWLFSDQVLLIGSSSGVHRVNTSSNGSILTQKDKSVKRQISFGCSKVPPQLVGNSPIYFQKSKVKARSINYAIQSDKYTATDLNIDSDHVLESGVIESSYQQDPISNLWCVRDDGQISIFTSEQAQEIECWSRFKTQGSFESIAILNNSEDTDEVYCVVKRTINGNVKRFIERQDSNFLVSNLERAFVDSFLTYNGTKTTQLTLNQLQGSSINVLANTSLFTTQDVGKEIHETNGKGRALVTAYVNNQNLTLDILEPFSSQIVNKWAFAVKTVTGLEHLEGASVSICSDGATEPEKQVINGTVTLSTAGSIVHVGLAYTSIQKSMPIEVRSLIQAMGSTQGKISRVDTVIVKVENTNGGKITSKTTKEGDITTETEDFILARSLNNNQNEVTPLFDGDIEVRVAASWESASQISVIQFGPQPMTIKSITYKTTVNDK